MQNLRVFFKNQLKYPLHFEKGSTNCDSGLNLPTDLYPSGWHPSMLVLIMFSKKGLKWPKNIVKIELYLR